MGKMDRDSWGKGRTREVFGHENLELHRNIDDLLRGLRRKRQDSQGSQGRRGRQDSAERRMLLAVGLLVDDGGGGGAPEVKGFQAGRLGEEGATVAGWPGWVAAGQT